MKELKENSKKICIFLLIINIPELIFFLIQNLPIIVAMPMAFYTQPLLKTYALAIFKTILVPVPIIAKRILEIFGMQNTSLYQKITDKSALCISTLLGIIFSLKLFIPISSLIAITIVTVVFINCLTIYIAKKFNKEKLYLSCKVDIKNFSNSLFEQLLAFINKTIFSPILPKDEMRKKVINKRLSKFSKSEYKWIKENIKPKIIIILIRIKFFLYALT